ncbi:uncharacterized protein DUF3558 [Streptomyces sp. KhCrAH-43]|uniref:DUF3558 domain-containing protein n=1 Tax=Streptomyces TaxID=1883 RepID=UPI000375ADEF|nr:MULTISPECIES: DUF3558 domain-containing protein [unclassified Streptomyces]MYS36282.1 DUF3558 domain-containing protein [Streptomyces sp. SID4920]MYX70911.1 DUF3558 domain-containing protein [Streptomyces sp. SID8373]RAJ56061.1 uncharacterized protein DUF3558 [Streptomyces sp. KhCrAH-43]
MHRSAPRLTRILACAAVPVMLLVAGCSSDSDGKKEADSSASASPDATKSEPAVEAAKFAELPDPCSSVEAKTIKTLVPSAKSKKGTRSKSSDASVRGGCSWNGLADKGVKGSQYRWLDVGFTRFASDQTLGSGAARAGDELSKQVKKTEATDGAKNVKTETVGGIGDQATKVTYDQSKTGEDFRFATIVARTGNVVVVVDYNGAGYAGSKTPSEESILKGATTAAKDAVSAVAEANGGAAESPKATDKATGKATAKATDKASDDSSKKPSKKPSSSAASKSSD